MKRPIVFFSYWIVSFAPKKAFNPSDTTLFFPHVLLAWQVLLLLSAGAPSTLHVPSNQVVSIKSISLLKEEKAPIGPYICRSTTSALQNWYIKANRITTSNNLYIKQGHHLYRVGASFNVLEVVSILYLFRCNEYIFPRCRYLFINLGMQCIEQF